LVLLLARPDQRLSAAYQHQPFVECEGAGHARPLELPMDVADRGVILLLPDPEPPRW
jgi:hypothetical protein